MFSWWTLYVLQTLPNSNPFGSWAEIKIFGNMSFLRGSRLHSLFCSSRLSTIKILRLIKNGGNDNKPYIEALLQQPFGSNTVEKHISQSCQILSIIIVDKNNHSYNQIKFYTNFRPNMGLTTNHLCLEQWNNRVNLSLQQGSSVAESIFVPTIKLDKSRYRLY